MPKVARLGDPTSCAGNVVSSSTDVFCNNIGVARVSADVDTCVICRPGVGNITTGSSNVFVNNCNMAHVGSSDTCVGVIIDGSSDTIVN